MADTKITALAAITTVDPAADVLPIVDISDTSMAASGTTKKITSNQILGAGGTATLASATITGDLTVRTNRLIVNSNGTGIGTTPSSWGAGTRGFELANGSVVSFAGYIGTVGTANSYYNGSNWIYTTTAAAARYDQDNGSHIWLNAPSGTAGNTVGWSTAMTLNSTGLAIGDTTFSGTRLTLRESATNPNALAMTNRNATQTWRLSVDVSAVDDKILGFYDSTSTTFRMQLTDTGNLGLGVTPSAFSGVKAVQVGTGAIYSVSSGSQCGILSNSFYDGAWKYITTSFAARYDQPNGSHQWFIAPSGTAGNAITFTQAMTLSAAGSLVLGAAAVATTATDGFLYIPGCAGTPTGTPTAQTGRVPLVVDTTNNKLYFYSGGSWVAAN